MHGNKWPIPQTLHLKSAKFFRNNIGKIFAKLSDKAPCRPEEKAKRFARKRMRRG